MMHETRKREELVRVCRHLQDRGLVAASDGNVSCRVGSDRMLITPSGRRKGGLEPLDLILCDVNEGTIVAGRGGASSEIRMHLLVYQQRVDVQAVVHAHPPLLTALTLAGIPFAAEILPEVWLSIGQVPTAPYATPGTQQLPAAISPFIKSCQAILMERHGSLTLGSSPEQACMRLEKLEHAAHTLFYCHLLQGKMPRPLSERDLARLDEAHRKASPA